MRFAVRDHQHKSKAFVEALERGGHEQHADADLLLTDGIFDHPAYRPLLERYESLLLYPHGANPMVVYDGVWESRSVVANLVPGPGHVEVAALVNGPAPTVVTGFPFCPQRPFSRSDGNRVLFAPHHPFGDGTLGAAEQAQNASMFAALSGYELTVRHVGTLSQNGLEPRPGVSYMQADMFIDFSDIDKADVVVAGYGTFAFMAVARGVPTVMFGQDIHPYDVRDGRAQRVKNWERYRDLVRYPFDASIGLSEAIEAARNHEATEWREQFIGPPFDPDAVCGALERRSFV